jgi:hypothetical protein
MASVGDERSLGVLLVALASVLALGLYGVLLLRERKEGTVYPVEFVTPFRYDASGDDERNLNGEFITLQNTGDAPVEMTGWTLRNALRVTYAFPEGFTLDPGAVVTLYSGCGDDSSEALYWCAERPVWNNDSGAATVLDEAGEKVAAHRYQRLCDTCGSKRDDETE